eukprot:gnl/Spiro4/12245_TR6460_c0_g1_i1.p2 gnl/Spiro4/12245_TR6460_c0_g1~~gnl/Spiro4/12245_TR6460_c0_g1_i1.p2  ORF type:complete len:219 (+),score=56.42 gnl/Spiro4/12245_TR6460_c0_g1_i1:28-684(+)
MENESAADSRSEQTISRGGEPLPPPTPPAPAPAPAPAPSVPTMAPPSAVPPPAPRPTSGKKKGGGGGKLGRLFRNYQFQELEDVPPRPTELWVDLEIKQVLFSHLDFELHIPLTTPILEIVQQITNRHGGAIRGVVLYLGCREDSTRIRNQLGTLAQCKIPGCARSARTARATIYYEFAVHPDNSPLLLYSPALSDKKVSPWQTTAPAAQEKVQQASA